MVRRGLRSIGSVRVVRGDRNGRGRYPRRSGVIVTFSAGTYVEDPPFVCPGCYAINEEPHAGYCPDAAIEREEADRQDRRDFENDLFQDDADE
jgi:hypothetical protein